MGVLADAVLGAGGRVVGVIPRALWDREVGHRALTELHVVETMHERKALMASLADAFIALPGGLGTLEARRCECRSGTAACAGVNARRAHEFHGVQCGRCSG